MRIAAFAAALLVLASPAVAQAQSVRPTAPAEGPRGGVAAAAARGDAEAQYQMGLAALKARRGGEAALKNAYVWFGLAAFNGSAAAAIEAAKAAESGKGIAKDPELAGHWWYRAAQLGNDEARARWTDLVINGRIPALESVESAGWIAELAQKGNSRAALALAGAYEHGLGIAANLGEAELWYRRAAIMQNDAEARFRLGRMLLARPAAWRVLENEEWSPKDADRRNRPFGAVWYAAKPADAADKATMFRPGIAEGTYWLTLAAREGHAEAQYLLGKAMVEGIELPLDLVDAVSWLRAAQTQGHGAATMLLARLTADGEGTLGKDPVRAYALYDLAASLGQGGAAQARDALGRDLGGRALARARQLAQDLRDNR